MTDMPTSRSDAKILGARTYFTGRPCKNQHVSPRRTDNGTCVLCLAETKTQYYAENPEKRKHHNATYYAKNSEHIKSLNSDWRTENADEMREIRRSYYERNKAIYISRSRARKEHIKQATPPWVNMAAIDAIYCEARRLTEQTGVPYDVDHIIPLRGVNVCGLHVAENLQVLTATENRSKGNNPSWPRRIREWTCSECGVIHDRDVNAAKNILAVGHGRPVEGIPVL